MKIKLAIVFLLFPLLNFGQSELKNTETCELKLTIDSLKYGEVYYIRLVSMDDTCFKEKSITITKDENGYYASYNEILHILLTSEKKKSKEKIKLVNSQIDLIRKLERKFHKGIHVNPPKSTGCFISLTTKDCYLKNQIKNYGWNEFDNLLKELFKGPN